MIIQYSFFGGAISVLKQEEENQNLKKILKEKYSFSENDNYSLIIIQLFNYNFI